MASLSFKKKLGFLFFFSASLIPLSHGAAVAAEEPHQTGHSHSLVQSLEEGVRKAIHHLHIGKENADPVKHPVHLGFRPSEEHHLRALKAARVILKHVGDNEAPQTSLPSSAKVDLSGIERLFQGNAGTCAVHAGVTTVMDLLGEGNAPQSRRFLYELALEAEGSLGTDAGTSFATIAAVLAKGNVPESDYLYTDTAELYTTTPSADLVAAAQAHTLTKESLVFTEFSLNNLDKIKESIHQGVPVMAGIPVYSSFGQDVKTGRIAYPDVEHETNNGGHAILIDGYDDATQLFHFRNWWKLDDGTPWGEGGDGYLPYAYLQNLGLEVATFTKETDTVVSSILKSRQAPRSLSFDPASLAELIQRKITAATTPLEVEIASLRDQIKALTTLAGAPASAVDEDELVVDAEAAPAIVSTTDGEDDVSASPTNGALPDTAPVIIHDEGTESAAPTSVLVPGTNVPSAPAAVETSDPENDASVDEPEGDPAASTADALAADPTQAAAPTSAGAEDVPTSPTNADVLAEISEEDAPTSPPANVGPGAPAASAGNDSAGDTQGVLLPQDSAVVDDGVNSTVILTGTETIDPTTSTSAPGVADAPSSSADGSATDTQAAPADISSILADDATATDDVSREGIGMAAAEDPSTARHSSVSGPSKPKGNWNNPTKSFVRKLAREGAPDEVLDMIEAKLDNAPSTDAAPAAMFQPASPPPAEPRNADELQDAGGPQVSLRSLSPASLTATISTVPAAAAPAASSSTLAHHSLVQEIEADMKGVEHALASGAKAVVKEIVGVAEDIVEALRPMVQAAGAQLAADVTAAVKEEAQAVSTTVVNKVEGAIQGAENAIGISSTPPVVTHPALTSEGPPASTRPRAPGVTKAAPLATATSPLVTTKPTPPAVVSPKGKKKHYAVPPAKSSSGRPTAPAVKKE